MSAEATVSQNATQSDAHTRLRGRWLLLARLAWVAVTVFAIGTFVSAIPLRYADLVTLSAPRVMSLLGQLVSSAVIRSNLAQDGLTTTFYATFDALLSIGFVLSFVVTALIIFARRSDDAMALLVSLALVTMGASFPSTTVALIAQSSFGAEHLLLFLAFSIGVVSFYLFPDGRFVPSWSRWLALVWVIFAIVLRWLPGSQGEAGTVQYNAGAVLALGVLSTIIVFQSYRYQRVSNLKQRQQTKWVVFGVAAAFIGFIALNLPLLANPSFYAPGSMAELIANLALVIFLLFIPASIGIAILRYHLYDIDLLINRTLVYVPLTAILAGIFAASITLSQKLSAALTGQQSDAATVLTTLIVVAVFEPLKSGLQQLVDRRFKEAPDPSKQLQAFGAQVQAVAQVMDSRRLTRRLLDVAMRAFGATSGAVYLGAGDAERMLHSSRDWKGEIALDIVMENAGRRIGRLALGARQGGEEYGLPDRATLQNAANIVAETIQMTLSGSGGHS